MKKNRIYPLLSVIAILAIGVLFFHQASAVSAASDARGGPGMRGGNGRAAEQAGAGLALSPLSIEEEQALEEAILEEYGALNLYQSVIEQFGSVYPFNQIVRAEQQHANALIRQAEKYGVQVPANPGLSEPPVFETLADACQAGVDAEIADAALYDTLKPVTVHTDLLQVYDNLQSASLNSHLPAFQTCD